MTTIAMLDARIAEVIAIVSSGRKVEDSTVELKRDWPALPKIARRIAGHANEMRGSSILWIIGIDEDDYTITGCEDKEMANWLPQLYAEFESNQSPELLLHRRFDHNGTQVIGLLFDTGAAPYLIKVRPKDVGGAMPDFEMPFRSGTKVNTAKRTQILRMLLQSTSAPKIDVISLQLSYNDANHISMVASVYVASSDRENLIIPRHRCAIGFRRTQDQPYIDMNPDDLSLWDEDLGSKTPRRAQVVVEAGARIRISGSLKANLAGFRDKPLFARIQLGFAHDDQPISLAFALTPKDRIWRLDR